MKRTHISNFAMSDALEKNNDLLLHYLERFKQPDFRITHGASEFLVRIMLQYVLCTTSHTMTSVDV